jgi:serine/threonine protein kinase
MPPAGVAAVSGGRATPPQPSAPPLLPPSLVVNVKRLRLSDKIGEGSFGVVYQGEYQREQVAVKKMHKQLSKDGAALAEFAQEVALMCRLKHPSLLTCIAANITPPDVMLVTEYMKRGTLFDVLYRDRIRLTTALVRKMALQAAEGLAYMHELGFLHRDLKSSNVLVDGSYNVKLGDFGLARDQSGANAAAAGGLSGTIQYLSPECLRGEPHTAKSDVYAYGLCLWEMVAGEPPYVGVDAMVAARQVLDDGLRPAIPPSCPRPYAAIIQACWANSPAARPTFREVIDRIKTTTK